MKPAYIKCSTRAYGEALTCISNAGEKSAVGLVHILCSSAVKMQVKFLLGWDMGFTWQSMWVQHKQKNPILTQAKIFFPIIVPLLLAPKCLPCEQTTSYNIWHPPFAVPCFCCTFSHKPTRWNIVHKITTSFGWQQQISICPWCGFWKMMVMMY